MIYADWKSDWTPTVVATYKKTVYDTLTGVYANGAYTIGDVGLASLPLASSVSQDYITFASGYAYINVPCTITLKGTVSASDLQYWWRYYLGVYHNDTLKLYWAGYQNNTSYSGSSTISCSAGDVIRLGIFTESEGTVAYNVTITLESLD